MAKKKPNRRKKQLADAKSEVSVKDDDKLNPFELKDNRKKLVIVGKSVKRHEKGAPGFSKLKAIEKRKETLLKDYMKSKKSNKFVDKRIGENESNISLEDKMLARFAVERQRRRSDNGLLNEEEELTHFGHNLATIEKFDDPVGESDDDDEERLNKNFVSNAHFGGFLVKKDAESSAKSRDSLLAEIIAKSKERKDLRHQEKETTDALTVELNEEWKKVQLLMRSFKKNDDEEPKKKEPNDYDVLIRELKYDTRAKATAPYKDEDELAKKERKEKELLEGKLLKRMEMKDTSNKKTVSHRSADDLDDSFEYDDDVDTSKTKEFKGQLLEDDENEEENDEEPDDIETSVVVNDEEILDAINVFIDFCKREDDKLVVETESGVKTFIARELKEISCDLEPSEDSMADILDNLYQLANRSALTFAKVVLNLLKENRQRFLKFSKRKESLIDMIILFKIVGLIYPTSDFRHPVTTVTMLLMSESLLKLNVNYSAHVFAGIEICHLFSKFTELSKRYVPESFIFLTATLDSLSNKFISAGTNSDIVIPQSIKDNRLFIVNNCVTLIREIVTNCRLTFFKQNLDNVKSNVEQLLSIDFSTQIKVNLNLLNEELRNNIGRKKLVQEHTKRFEMKLLEPKIISREENKKQLSDKRLVRAHRREMKGAMREVRKDNRFLASQKMKEQHDRDVANKRKLKELLQDISEERGYYKKKSKKGF